MTTLGVQNVSDRQFKRCFIAEFVNGLPVLERMLQAEVQKGILTQATIDKFMISFKELKAELNLNLKQKG